MDFVELNRNFAPIDKDEELDPNMGRIWGHKIAGWLRWPELLKYRRAVLLAEAAGGKTREFANQASVLSAQGETAFFITIESLVDGGVTSLLDPDEERALEHWLADGAAGDGWFFLDSVDEARLSQKKLETALANFVRGIGSQLGRAHVYLSCRASDWKGREDRETIERRLRVPQEPSSPEAIDRDAALLDPIFKQKEQPKPSSTEAEAEAKYSSLLVVQLVPLDDEQQRKLMVASGIEKPEEAAAQIEKCDLGSLADRPGDLLELADYWRQKGHFDGLSKMVEHGIRSKLSERDRSRPDNTHLSSEKARMGAERLAAALTLAKSWTIRSPGHPPEPGLANGAIDPEAVLPEWNDAERSALLRRGLFAPSTYGRVRFHHRGTQEYLTAQWLNRLLRAGCPRDTVWQLLFAERYGVKTLVPSLHPVAAWLAVDHPDIREEILKREPLVLLRYGDPHSLPLEVKKRLLLIYAERHLAGNISNDSLDRRSLALFSVPELGDAVRKAWSLNGREDFRLDLLRFIREGTITSCSDLARGVALDEDARDGMRIFAVQALQACGDREGLAAVAKWLSRNPERASSSLGPEFAVALYPQHLATDDLLEVIRLSPRPRPHSSEGFGHVLPALWQATGTPDARERLLSGLADLALSPPFVASYQRVSSRYAELAEGMESLARDALLRYEDKEPSGGLLRILMAVERAVRSYPFNRDEPSLGALVCGHTELRRRLFWADIEEARQNPDRPGDQVTHYGMVWFFGRELCRLEPSDVRWLIEDMGHRPLLDDKQVALSAVCDLLVVPGELEEEAPALRHALAGCDDLLGILNYRLSPPAESGEERRRRIEVERRRGDRETQIQAARREEEEDWLRFRDEAISLAPTLDDPESMANWVDDQAMLNRLAHWLWSTVRGGYVEATSQWELLATGFGEAVSQAYRSGMKMLWRRVQSGPPDDGRGSFAASTHLALTGLAIESKESPDWIADLGESDATKAIQHACFSGGECPHWLGALVDAYPSQGLPTLRQALEYELSSPAMEHTRLLHHFSNGNSPIPPGIQRLLVEVIMGSLPMSADAVNRAVGVFARVSHSEAEVLRAIPIVGQQYWTARRAGNLPSAKYYLAMFFLAQVEQAVAELAGWADSSPPTTTLATITMLFGRNSPVSVALDRASVHSLATLAGLAYQHIRREDDEVHEGCYSPGPRDHAQEARGNVLSALLSRPGRDAYLAVLSLADKESYPESALRFRELARGMAERDTEFPAWTPQEVCFFEENHLMPAKTGEALLGMVAGVLSDIRTSAARADASSLPVLAHAQDEDEVQEWLAEQLRIRLGRRFQVHREAQIARGDKPDIIATSTAASVQVAIEAKHGGKGWTVRELEEALVDQLAGKYLKPENRRWGVLVITHHGNRTWRDPESRKKLEFGDLIKRLEALALEISSGGGVTVRVCGIDASPVK